MPIFVTVWHIMKRAIGILRAPYMCFLADCVPASNRNFKTKIKKVEKVLKVVPNSLFSLSRKIGDEPLLLGALSLCPVLFLPQFPYAD